jgi:outer membrane protein OmpA-like peptidoglycan-associated protein
MRPPIAVAIAAALAFTALSFGSMGPAAAFSKEELVQQLTRKIQPGSFSAAPQGPAQLIVDPGVVKRKKLPMHQMMIIKPQPVIATPAGKTQMVVEPMIIQPSGGIKATPVKSTPPIVKMVADPHPIIATPNLDALHQMSQRKIVVEERKQLAAAVKQDDLPSVDLEVYFAYDSAAIEPSALQALITLGQALSDVRLSGGTFLIAGHTDAIGSPAYNQGLSERRASAIKSFLVQNFHIDAQSLIAVGYGEEQLKDTANPTSGVNRRVQVANLSQ